MTTVHTPVLLNEVVAALQPSAGKRYIDATLGGAGHTMAILEADAEVVGVDRDNQILAIANKRIADAGYSERFTAVHATFADALDPQKSSLTGAYDGILFDLGVSSLQLDTVSRGFSFMHDAPLDMRMDSSLAVTAADLVNGLGKRELAELFELLGEERYARQVAGKIIERRKIKPIRTTRELARIIEETVPKKTSASRRIHPATRIFQALRMAVNSEREELKAALPSALSWLTPGGTLAVISFHSLEDKIVTDFFDGQVAASAMKVEGGAITPTESEIKSNPRSRSAKLRVGRKIS